MIFFTGVTILSALFFATIDTNASPIKGPQSLIVYSPNITSPTANLTWPVGSIQNVTWDTSNIPSEKQNSSGLLLLGHASNDTDSEHLDTEHPLASDFLIKSGWVMITVPECEERKDYLVVLFGDSGNTSPKFSIVHNGTSS